VIGDPEVQDVIEHNGWLKGQGFTVQWVNIHGGPAITEAFHAGALDVGISADVPPIHAIWVGIPVKIIAVRLHRDPAAHPLYVLGIAPHAQLRTLAELRGKRIAYSPGQVQGEVVLRTLKEQGLAASDVTLVELPSTADVYFDALSSGAVDVAPIAAGAVAKRYVEHFGGQGARVLPHGPFRDDLTLLYVREATLLDPDKAAALRRYIALWVRANQWIGSHPQGWAQLYWVRNQQLSDKDAGYQIDALGPRYTPADFTEAIKIERDAIDILAPATQQKPFAADSLFDRRFEAVISGALAQVAPSAATGSAR
jgi:sulfonate transport system substrate-binding protein